MIAMGIVSDMDLDAKALVELDAKSPGALTTHSQSVMPTSSRAANNFKRRVDDLKIPEVRCNASQHEPEPHMHDQ